MTYAIGIDLGGTNIKGVLIDEKGKEVTRLIQPTEDQRQGNLNNGQNWKEAVRKVVFELKALKPSIEAIGLAAPGIANSDNTAIACMPGRLFGLEQFHWGKFLGKKRVPVLNDAHAAIIAEHSYGAGKGYRHIALFTLGTGVGGGLILDGKLHQGFIQRAGHLGHISLNADSLDLAISNNPAALELAIGDVTLEKRSMGKYKSTHELVKAYRQGDTFASYVWLHSIKRLAVGISSVINAVSPEIVILGGGMIKAGNALFEPLKAFMEIYEWRPDGIAVPMKAAEFSDYAGAIGAASYALKEYH